MSDTPSTVPALFEARVAATPDVVAFEYPTGRRTWGKMTWREADARVRAVSCGLRALGVEKEQRCAILSTTRLEWVLCDLGILSAGAATTTLYPSNTPAECAYIINDSQTAVVFAEEPSQVEKLREIRGDVPQVLKVVLFQGETEGDDWVVPLQGLEALGRTWDAAHPGAYDELRRSVGKDDLATLIYTSGTTGKPKGVELVHDCWVFEAEAIADTGILRPDDHQLLWLPLSHSFGKVMQVAQLKIGFPTTVDGRIARLIENLPVVRPTFMAAAPRIFEKVHNKVLATAGEGGALRQRVFHWALDVGRRASRERQKGRGPRGLLAAQLALADRLVLSKIRERFGGRLRFFISGSAPLTREMSEFFHAAGVLILEGYGLTESSAASFVNRPERFKFGTVGPALPGVEVRVAPEDSEILVRGRGVMRGYHDLPEATRETLDPEGWLHTGDIGELDADGFLRITDRKKDLIKTSGGKYVAPQKLEGKLKSLNPYLSQVIVHGNQRNYVTALVTLDEDQIKGFAAQHGLEGRPLEEIAKSDETRAMVKGSIDRLNGELASYETVKKFAILPRDLSEAEGELTASQKVRRRVVEQHFKDVLDGFYAGVVRH